MNLPIEVWAIVFKYLRLIDLVEISCVCKTFYRLCEKYQYYAKKLRESNDICKEKSWLVETYKKLLERFYFAIYREIVVYFPVSKIHCLKKKIFLECIIHCYRFVSGIMFSFAVGLSMKVICACFVQSYA